MSHSIDGAGDAAGLRASIFSVVDHYPDGPRSIAELYAEIGAACERAERLGYDSFFVAEHHFAPYGVAPNPPVLLAALAQRTRRIRLGPAVAVLPFHDPRHVAESYAMLDALSGGRVMLGVGSGYLKHEFAGHGVAEEEKRERFDESLAILERLLAGETVTFEGRFHRLAEVAINVRPVQRPAPPLYVAVLRREAAYHVGRRGRRIISVPYATLDRVGELRGFVDEYRRGRAEAGAPAGPDDMLFAFHTHVAESDEAARRAAERPFDRYVETRRYARRQVYDDILHSGLGLFGGVETVAERLVELHAMGVRHVLTLQDFGQMPASEVEQSMRLFAEEVLPRVARRLRQAPTGQ
jgi:alkanesulfonate monooxygenase SsuD/methylene tetrahydromethanopterin reductase-like flavin-dependent oxidoreductase (luciferase family)